MYATIEKWQATVLVLASIAALVALALAGDVPAELVVGAIGGIPTLVLGAAAAVHGARQNARSTTDALDKERATERSS